MIVTARRAAPYSVGQQGHQQRQQAGIGRVGDPDRRGAAGAVELDGGAGDSADDLGEVGQLDRNVALPGRLGGKAVNGGIRLELQAKVEAIGIPDQCGRGWELAARLGGRGQPAEGGYEQVAVNGNGVAAGLRNHALVVGKFAVDQLGDESEARRRQFEQVRELRSETRSFVFASSLAAIFMDASETIAPRSVPLAGTPSFSNRCPSVPTAVSVCSLTR